MTQAYKQLLKKANLCSLSINPPREEAGRGSAMVDVQGEVGGAVCALFPAFRSS